MTEWFFELLTILCFSRRTLFAIILGMLGYIAISLIGKHMVGDFQLSGYLAPMSDLVKENLLGKYDKAAIGWLVSSWLLAIKLYRKDKKRFYRF